MHAARDNHHPAGDQPARFAAGRYSACCNRCGADAARLATAGARFCPRCGLRRSDPSAAAAEEFGVHATSGAVVIGPTAASASQTSTVIRGYANAMFRLGVRYEVRHNEDEAVRCFGKAAGLGSASARVRLLDISLEKVVGGPDDPRQPP